MNEKPEISYINLADDYMQKGELEKSLIIMKIGIICYPSNIDLLNFLFKIKLFFGILDQCPTPGHALLISAGNGLALFYKRKQQVHQLERDGKYSEAKRILNTLRNVIPEESPFYISQETFIQESLAAWRTESY